jgi:PAS domain S-box-containing protein
MRKSASLYFRTPELRMKMSNLGQHKILLADDVEIHIRTLANALYDDYDILVVTDGNSALEHARKHLPDMILLDIIMPGMNGFEVCRGLKSDPATKDIPVIFLTALGELENKTEGFEAGAADYITKPFDPLEVRARVKTHLDLRDSHNKLKKINIQLNSEISERMQAESALQKLAGELEQRVEERTAELLKSNMQLRDEIERHRRTLASLKASEERYRFLTENVADGVYILREGKLSLVNSAFANIFGYSEHQLIGKDPVFLIRGDYRDRFKDIRKKIEKEGRVKGFHIPCIRGDGREIWTEGRYNIVQWEGKTAILGTVRDITKRKLREIQIAEEKESLLRQVAGLRASVGDCYKFGDIIGKSSGMRDVYKVITEASASDDNVIIYGESGTGKELIARTIHALSSRKDNAFVPVNCGAIPESLFESEFFGHRKGAFTGADSDRPGFFERADRGILFLDEVGELGANMQVKLLRAIESGEYTPVGSTKARSADVRIIAATNRNIQDILKKGGMREDFFYRIHVIPISVPPLRHRREDIPLLIDHFLSRYSDEKNSRTFPGEILAALCHHPWPGNVRELQNVLKRWLAMNRLDFVTGPPLSVQENIYQEDQLLCDAVQAFEKELISKTLERHQGHRANTAESLGITERTLYRKMRQYGLRLLDD